MKTWQDKFSDFLYTQAETPQEILDMLGNDSDGPRSSASKPTDQKPSSIEKGLLVYRNNLLHGAIDRLRSVFPATEKSVGDDNFKYFVSRYINETPSRHPDASVHAFGFPRFLQSRTELMYTPWIHELCLFECLVAFPESQNGILAHGLRLAEMVDVEKFSYDLFNYWSPDLASRIERATFPEKKPCLVLFRGPSFDRRLSLVSGCRFDFLLHVKRGHPPTRFHSPEISEANDLIHMVQSLIGDGLLVVAET